MMKTFGIKKLGLVSCGTVATLGIVVGLASEPVRASDRPQILAQQETTETVETCMALQEVSTGQTEIRKRIENRALSRGNWNTDFLVPNDQDFDYFVAIITPENTAPYEFTANLRLPGGGSEMAFSARSEVQAGTTYSIPFQSPTGRQPTAVNARVGGVNGNYYTIAIAGCQSSYNVTNSDLTGTTWQLQQIQFNDGQLLIADPPENYTAEFTNNGELFVQADCNRAIGQYSVEGDSGITIAMGPTTLAACPPGSISNDYLQALGNGTLFFFQDGDLFIDLKFDSGTMRFSPAN
jgi:heat shock protein HslJ